MVAMALAASVNPPTKAYIRQPNRPPEDDHVLVNHSPALPQSSHCINSGLSHRTDHDFDVPAHHVLQQGWLTELRVTFFFSSCITVVVLIFTIRAVSHRIG